jgi:hypothetical protein
VRTSTELPADTGPTCSAGHGARCPALWSSDLARCRLAKLNSTAYTRPARPDRECTVAPAAASALPRSNSRACGASRLASAQRRPPRVTRSPGGMSNSSRRVPGGGYVDGGEGSLAGQVAAQPQLHVPGGHDIAGEARHHAGHVFEPVPQHPTERDASADKSAVERVWPGGTGWSAVTGLAVPGP